MNDDFQFSMFSLEEKATYRDCGVLSLRGACILTSSCSLLTYLDSKHGSHLLCMRRFVSPPAVVAVIFPSLGFQETFFGVIISTSLRLCFHPLIICMLSWGFVDQILFLRLYAALAPCLNTLNIKLIATSCAHWHNSATDIYSSGFSITLYSRLLD